MFCPNCGSQVGEQTQFCPICGSRIILAGQQAQQGSDPGSQQQTWQQPSPAQVYQQQAQPYQQQPYQQTYQQQPYQQQPYQQAYQQQPYQQAYQQQPYQAQAYEQQAYQQQPYQQQAYQAQPAYTTIQAQKPSRKKGLFIGLGCLVLAALVGGGIWFLTRGQAKPLDRLAKAGRESLAALEDLTKELPQLHSILDNVEALEEAGTLSLSMEVRSTSSVSFGDEHHSYSAGVKLSAETEKAANRTLLQGSYDSGDGELPFTLYLDPEQLQLASEALLGEKVLSLPVRDLGRQWNDSALAELTGVELPADFGLPTLGSEGLSSSLEAAYGETWTQFYDSIDLVELESGARFTDGGTTYRLSWDQSLLETMHRQSDNDVQDLPDIEDLDDLTDFDLQKLAANALVELLWELNGRIQDSQIQIRDGALTGIYLPTGQDGAPDYVELRLLGTENPWERISLVIFTDYSSYRVTDTTSIDLRAADGQLRISVTNQHEDSDGPEYCYEEGPVELIYSDADGSIRVEMEGESLTEGDLVRLTPAAGGFHFELRTEEGDDEDSFRMEQSLTVAGSSASVQAPSDKPTELLKLTEQELQELFEALEETGMGLIE